MKKLKEQTIEKNAYAKVNLYLDVLGKNFDNYHEVKLVMQSISLHDKVSVTLSYNENKMDVPITLTCSDKSVPNDKENLAYKAALLYIDMISKEDEFANIGESGIALSIKLEKHIPSGAGLGGGSADAGAVLLIINELFSNHYTIAELLSLASKLGADVPFMLINGTMECTGIGDVLSPLDDMKDCFLLLYKDNNKFCSTKEIYKMLDEAMILSKINVDSYDKRFHTLVDALKEGDIKKTANSLYNKFLEMLEIFDEERKIADKMIEFGALGATMSGSGNTVFGIFESESDAQKAKEKLKDDSKFIEICNSLSN